MVNDGLVPDDVGPLSLSLNAIRVCPVPLPRGSGRSAVHPVAPLLLVLRLAPRHLGVRGRGCQLRAALPGAGDGVLRQGHVQGVLGRHQRPQLRQQPLPEARTPAHAACTGPSKRCGVADLLPFGVM